MTRADPDPPRASSRPRPIPLEASGAGAWLTRCRKTLVAVVLRPMQSFAVCPEPIDHGRVLRFLATVRVPLWLLLLASMAVQAATTPAGVPAPMRSIYTYVEPALGRVLSLWIVLLIPVGLPLLYFFSGLAAHVGVALTGGASRSIGASMRAIGYVLGLVLLVVGVVDIPLYLGHVPGVVYLGMLGGIAILLWSLGGIALARTHQISVLRGVLVAVLPTLVFVAVTGGRAVLELSAVPLLDPPGGPYALP